MNLHAKTKLSCFRQLKNCGYFSLCVITMLHLEPILKSSRETHQNISEWQRAFCVWEASGLSMEDIKRRCAEALPVEIDELECFRSMAFPRRKNHPRLDSRCISADFTDADIDVNLLTERMARVRQEYAMVVMDKAHERETSGILITVIVKDETRLLLMSIIWHLLQGVHHYLICDHSSSNTALRQVVEPLVTAGLVTVWKYSGSGPIQQKCYDDGLALARKKGCRWQGGLDADEFVVVSKRFAGIEHALETFAERAKSVNAPHSIGAVGFNWLIQDKYDQTTVDYACDLRVTPAEKLDFAIGYPNSHIKSFALVNVTKSWNFVHFPTAFLDHQAIVVTSGSSRISSVQEMFDTKPALDEAAVMHYRMRTTQELAAKRERGRATYDCEDPKSLGDQMCSEVHHARRSNQQVSQIITEYNSWDPARVRGNWSCEKLKSIPHMRELLVSLASAVSQILGSKKDDLHCDFGKSLGGKNY